MNVYVVGAGVSKTVGYPLGGDLLHEVEELIRLSGSSLRLPEFTAVGPVLRAWLEMNSDPIIAESYRSGNLEYVFTALDLSWNLFLLKLNKLARRQGGARRSPVVTTDKDLRAYEMATQQHQRIRQTLLWALDEYLRRRHKEDGLTFPTSTWADLRRFAAMLGEGDVVITFNYDSTLERVLFQQGKWSPSDGYGFKVDLWHSMSDRTPVPIAQSKVSTLHLHGSVGWYYKLALPGGMVIADARLSSSEKLETLHKTLEESIALDPLFLMELGINAIDSWLPDPPPQDRMIVLHPSFLKSFGPEGQKTIFINLWRKAADALRAADRIFVIGYSLPEADSAAMALLLTNCDREKVEIVNMDIETSERLHLLLSSHWVDVRPDDFHDWVNRKPPRSKE